MPASLHIGDGFARIGGVTLPARASARGLELGSGAVLQPVSFGLRSRLVAWSGGGLGEALLAECLQGPADGLEPLALQALALHLAGADSGAPGFTSAAALVARLMGWPLAAINDAEALEIDRLASSLAPAMDQAADDGWTTVVFSGGPAGNGDDEPLDAICARLTADLQRRGAAGISPAEAAILSAAPPAQRQQPDWPQAPAAGARGFGPAPANAAGAVAGFGAATRPAAAPDAGSPPAPWRGTSALPDGFASPSRDNAASTGWPPASARSERPDAGVWAVPGVDGNPSLAFQPTPTGSPARPDGMQGSTDGSATAQGSGSAAPPEAIAGTQQLAMPAATGSPATGHSGTQAMEHSAPLQAQARAEPLPETPSLAPPKGGFAQGDAPTRASLFWDAVAAPAHQTTGFAPPSGPAAAPSYPPAVQTQAQPLDLDAIADALHAIADLRGVAR